MNIRYSFLVVLALQLMVVSAQAKPLKVVYHDKVTTKFKWQWPYKTTQTKTYLQTKPYFYTGRLLNVAKEDLSKYRFHYSQRVCMNSWGYFFHPSDKLCSKQILTFPPPTRGDEVQIVSKY